MEHVLHGADGTQLARIVANNMDLFDRLYPRNEGHPPNFIKMAKRKVQANAWDSAPNGLLLARLGSMFNHSCCPNALVLQRTLSFADGKEEDGIHFIGIVTLADIHDDEELTISYGAKRGHRDDDDFKCNCELDEKQRQQRFAGLEATKCTSFGLLDNYIRQYIERDDPFYYILAVHMASREGLYLNGSQYRLSSSFMQKHGLQNCDMQQTVTPFCDQRMTEYKFRVPIMNKAESVSFGQAAPIMEGTQA